MTFSGAAINRAARATDFHLVFSGDNNAASESLSFFLPLSAAALTSAGITRIHEGTRAKVKGGGCNAYARVGPGNERGKLCKWRERTNGY